MSQHLATAEELERQAAEAAAAEAAAAAAQLAEAERAAAGEGGVQAGSLLEFSRLFGSLRFQDGRTHLYSLYTSH